MAERRGDATFDFTVEGLDPRRSYAFAISAYSEGGQESTLSNEVTLPSSLGPCAGQPEGAACDIGDLCAASTCADGMCVAGLVPDGPSGVRLTLRGRVLRGRGRVEGLGRGDLADAGFDMRLSGRDGVILLQEVVPPESFRVRRNGKLLRYRRRGTGGLRRLVLRRRGDTLRIRFRSLLQRPPADWIQPFTLTVRLGASCASTAAVPCRVTQNLRHCQPN